MNRDPLSVAIAFYERVSKEKVFSIRPIEGEHDNELFVINYANVLRLKNVSALEKRFFLRRGEWHLYKASVNNKYILPAPNFLFYDSSGNKIEQYVEVIRPFIEDSEVERERDLKKAVHAITRLQGNPQLEGFFEPFDRFRHYQKDCSNPLPARFVEDAITRAGQIFDRYALVPSHNHLLPDNLTLRDDEMAFIDYSWSGRNAPIYDLASLCEEQEFSTALQRSALFHYLSMNPLYEYSIEDLEAVMLFIDALEYYYADARFRESGQQRFRQRAEKKKKRFLFAFNAHLWEGQE